MVRIERISEEGWATFREIRLRSLLDAPEAFGSTHGEESSRPEGAWRDWTAGRWRGGTAAVFLARRDEQPLGTATGAVYDADTATAHVYAMWVAPDARGAGIGRALVDAVAGWADDRGCTRLVLNVTESNAPALALYGSCGFEDTGEREPLRDGSDLQVLVLSKRL